MKYETLTQGRIWEINDVSKKTGLEQRFKIFDSDEEHLNGDISK